MTRDLQRRFAPASIQWLQMRKPVGSSGAQEGARLHGRELEDAGAALHVVVRRGARVCIAEPTDR